MNNRQLVRTEIQIKEIYSETELFQWFELKRVETDHSKMGYTEKEFEWRVYEKGSDGYSGLAGQYKDTREGFAQAMKFIAENTKYTDTLQAHVRTIKTNSPKNQLIALRRTS